MTESRTTSTVIPVGLRADVGTLRVYHEMHHEPRPVDVAVVTEWGL